MNVTGSMIVSIPLWLFATIFFLYLLKPRPAFQSREKYPIHALMCVSFGSMFAALAKWTWDGVMTMGMFISIPFWICAAIFASATVGCLLDKRAGETDGDLVAQGIIGLVITGVLIIIAALIVKLL